MYPTSRVIIDCTEIYIEKPSSVRSQAATYSNYKHYNTAKGLLGIASSGAVSFVADLFVGRTSEKRQHWSVVLTTYWKREILS